MTKWRIPGKGIQGPYCNSIMGKIGNHDLTVWKYQHYHCHDRDCPVCEPYDRTRRVNTIANKIIKVGNPRHFIFSPEGDEYENIKYAREQLYGALGLLGITGAVVIFHPFRSTSFGGNKYNDTDSLYFSPHFHVLCWGNYEYRADEFNELTGWVYKNMGFRKNIKGTLYYLLSHCGVATKQHSVTYWGCPRGYIKKGMKSDPIPSEKMYTYKAFNTLTRERVVFVKRDRSGNEISLDGDPIVWLKSDWGTTTKARRLIYMKKFKLRV